MIDSVIASGDKIFQSVRKLEIIWIVLISLSYDGLCRKTVNVKCSYSEWTMADTSLVSWLFSFFSKEAQPSYNC